MPRRCLGCAPALLTWPATSAGAQAAGGVLPQRAGTAARHQGCDAAAGPRLGGSLPGHLLRYSVPRAVRLATSRLFLNTALSPTDRCSRVGGSCCRLPIQLSASTAALAALGRLTLTLPGRTCEGAGQGAAAPPDGTDRTAIGGSAWKGWGPAQDSRAQRAQRSACHAQQARRVQGMPGRAAAATEKEEAAPRCGSAHHCLEDKGGGGGGRGAIPAHLHIACSRHTQQERDDGGGRAARAGRGEDGGPTPRCGCGVYPQASTVQGAGSCPEAGPHHTQPARCRRSPARLQGRVQGGGDAASCLHGRLWCPPPAAHTLACLPASLSPQAKAAQAAAAAAAAASQPASRPPALTLGVCAQLGSLGDLQVCGLHDAGLEAGGRQGGGELEVGGGGASGGHHLEHAAQRLEERVLVGAELRGGGGGGGGVGWRCMREGAGG